MLELWITDFKSTEVSFSVPGGIGTWDFHQKDNYAEILEKIQIGQCASTYYAGNASISHSISDEDFITATNELIDACLILSFISASCVTPCRSTMGSEMLFAELGDTFIRSRAISGFDKLEISQSYSQYFLKGMPAICTAMKSRRLRLFLSHWISGITCFSLEDLFLSIGVQMDIVKQCEIKEVGKKLDYFPGMQAASKRYGLVPLSKDYKAMRDDLVHEGLLSGTNFYHKSKEECAILDLGTPQPRWKGHKLQGGLPALSISQ